MPTNNSLISALVDTQKQVDGLSRQGVHACGGTWTHSTTQPMSSGAGTYMVFDTEIRNSGITRGATNYDFTVNTGGMFLFNINFFLSGTATLHLLYLVVNGLTVCQFAGYGASSPNYHTGMTMKYLQKNHTVRFLLVGINSSTIGVSSEDSQQESPILQICQVSPKFTNS